jgi:hypothetical protein
LYGTVPSTRSSVEGQQMTNYYENVSTVTSYKTGMQQDDSYDSLRYTTGTIFKYDQLRIIHSPCLFKLF